jgi:glycosyltransferase involved in cell wall biosynthesis
MDVSFAVEALWRGRPNNGMCRVTLEWLRHLPAALGAPVTATVSLSYDPLTCEKRMQMLSSRLAGAELERAFVSRSGHDRLYRPLTRGRELDASERALRRLLLAVDTRRIEHRYDVLHSVTEPLPSRCEGRAQVLCVFDLIPIRCTDNAVVTAKARAVIGSAGQADVIVVNTQWVKGELVELCGVAPERVAVVPLAASEVFSDLPEAARRTALRAAIAVNQPYFLALHADERKNTGTAIDAYLKATEGLRDAPELVIVGGRTIPIEHPRIRLLDAVPDQTLAVLMADTLGFLYLSSAEGFGLPVVEAMSAGAPVVAAASTCLPEVVGSGGICVPEANVEDVASVILGLATDSSLRTRLSDAGRIRAREFSWAASARALADVYRIAHERRA